MKEYILNNLDKHFLEYKIENSSEEIIEYGIISFDLIIEKILSIDDNNIINIDIPYFLRNLNLLNGIYKCSFNFYEIIIGNIIELEKQLSIKQISNSRKEIELVLLQENETINNQILEFGNLETFQLQYYFYNTENKYSNLIINKKINSNNNLLIKLYSELLDEYSIESKFIIVKKILDTFTENINLKTTFNSKNNISNLNYLSSPNINIKNNYFNFYSTNFENFNSLTHNNEKYITEYINSLYLSASIIEGIDINIDYSNLSEFVYFSSAKKRIENFKNKILLLQSVEKSIDNIENLNQSSKESLLDINIKINNKKQHIINTFDGFEKYLYYNTESVNINQKYFINPYPKQINGNLYDITSSNAQLWFSQSILMATEYDKNNSNMILRLIPYQILYNYYNKDYINFILMIAHLFDINYNYIKRINSINNRENSINTGIPNELLYFTINSFGFKLTSGTILKDLYNNIPIKINY